MLAEVWPFPRLFLNSFLIRMDTNQRGGGKRSVRCYALWCARMYTNKIKSLILTLKSLIYLNGTCGRNVGNNFGKQLVWYNWKNKGRTGMCGFSKLFCLKKSMVRCLAKNDTRRSLQIFCCSIFTYNSVLLSFKWINIIHLTHKHNLRGKSLMNIDMNMSK